MAAWQLYDLLMERVLASHTADAPVAEVLIGLTRTLCQIKGTAPGLAMSPDTTTRTLPWCGTLAGRPARELVLWLTSWDPDQATVGMYELPEAQWVFLTATSIPTKAFPRLAELATQARWVLMGPTVPWLPALAEHGVDILAGGRVEDPAALRRAVAEGGGTRIVETGVGYVVQSLPHR